MGNAAIIGTTSSHGGTMISASGSAFQTPGGAVCLQGDQHSCPIHGHGVTGISSGCATNTQVGGTPVAMQGSVAGCGATLIGNFAPDTTVT